MADTMKRYTLSELQGMWQCQRNNLECVKVVDQTRLQLTLIAPELGGKVCPSGRCATVMFPCWTKAKCWAHNKRTGGIGDRMWAREEEQDDAIATAGEIKRKRHQETVDDGGTAPPGSGVYAKGLMGTVQWAGDIWDLVRGKQKQFPLHQPQPRSSSNGESSPPHSQTHHANFSLPLCLNHTIHTNPPHTFTLGKVKINVSGGA